MTNKIFNKVCIYGAGAIGGWIGARLAKAGSEVREGDVMEIRFGSRLGRYEITAIRETVRNEEAALMYRVLQEDATTQQERNA